MSVTIELPAEDLARIRELTSTNSDAEAVSQATREFLRMKGLQELKAISGKVEFEENWRELEDLELAEQVHSS